MGVAFWVFACSSAAAQKPWPAAVCSVNIWKWLLGVWPLRQEGSEKVLGSGGRKVEGSWDTSLKRAAVRADEQPGGGRGDYKWGPGLTPGNGRAYLWKRNRGQVRVVLGTALDPLNSPQCKQRPLPLLVRGTLSQCWQFGLNLVRVAFKFIIELGRLRSSLGKRLPCDHVGTPFPRNPPLSLACCFLSYFLRLCFTIWKVVIIVPSCGVL